MTVTRPHPSLADILALMRRSSHQRATPDAVDLPGILGVARGPAPCLWVHANADVQVLQELVATAPDLLEVNVEASCPAARDALLASGNWRAGNESIHYVQTGAAPPLIVVPDVEMHAATADDMVLVRRALAQAFHIPVRVVEAAYPDEFLELAAPVRLLLARCRSGELLGTVACRMQDDAAMIFALTVNSEHRRRGLAAALVTAAIAAAHDDGAQFVHGLTNRASTPTARALGGRPVGQWTHLLRCEPQIATNI